jgi:3-oxoacyl-[acyl-carrier-protein] synthase II
MVQHNRVVVTGMGAITPIGLTKDDFWNNLIAGTSGTATITHFDASNHKCKVAAEVKGYDPTKHFDGKALRQLDIFVQYGIVAAREAFKDAGFRDGDYDPERVGVLVGSGIGSIAVIAEQAVILHEKGPRRVTPFLIPKAICNEAAGNISIDLGLKGPNTCVVTACATGTHAIGDAAAIVARGDADAMVCGGTEGAIISLAIAGFGNMGALAEENERPETASRPFDKNRNGFVMGEGAGILVVESLEHARKRGARIYAEVVGYGMTGDAYHITAPAPGGEGGARAIRAALKQAELAPEQVDYINAHGTSTPLNDKLETEGIKKVFGAHAYKLAVSSNKSMIGHLIGAAGAVEAIATVLTIVNGIIPPTINYNEPDPDCDLDYVPNKARESKVNVAMSSSLGFGGHNCSIALRKFDE